MTKPVKTYRAGACSASVFLNDRKTEKGSWTYPTVAFSCRYHDEGTGEWKDSSAMTANEVARALVVLREALDYCWLKRSANDPDQTTSE